MAMRKFTLEGGIDGSQQMAVGYDSGWARGPVQSLIDAGLIEPDWVAQKPRRRKETWVGGRLIVTERFADGEVRVIFTGAQIKPAQRRGTAPAYDGNAKASWSQCAWQPTGRPIPTVGSPLKPAAVAALKDTLRMFAKQKEPRCSVFGAATLGYIAQLEQVVFGLAKTKVAR